MSQENIEIVKRAITAINERDVAAYLAVCASDFELINPIAEIEGSNKGEQGVRAFFDAIREGATKFEMEIERLEASTTTVFWLGSRWTWRAKAAFHRDSRSRTSTN
jgi:ketosteroid isomerase-like protein